MLFLGFMINETLVWQPWAHFNVLFSRPGKRPIEVMCSARHSRRQGDAFIIGAEFGVSWLSAVSAAMM